MIKYLFFILLIISCNSKTDIDHDKKEKGLFYKNDKLFTGNDTLALDFLLPDTVFDVTVYSKGKVVDYFTIDKSLESLRILQYFPDQQEDSILFITGNGLEFKHKDSVKYFFLYRNGTNTLKASVVTDMSDFILDKKCYYKEAEPEPCLSADNWPLSVKNFNTI